MPIFNSETLQLVLQLVVGVIFLAGCTALLFLAFKIQTTPYKSCVSKITFLKQTPFTFQHATYVIGVTLFFALPGLFPESEKIPDNLALLLGPLLYFACGILTVSLILLNRRITFDTAFFNTPESVRSQISKGVLYGLAVIPFITLLSMGINVLLDRYGYPPQQQAIFDWLTDPTRPMGVRLGLIAFAIVLAPIVEEFLFRGVLLGSFVQKRGWATGIWLPALYFAVVHLDLAAFVPLFVLGIAFSLAYAATGSLVTPIVMHALFNFTSLIIYLSQPVT